MKNGITYNGIEIELTTLETLALIGCLNDVASVTVMEPNPTIRAKSKLAVMLMLPQISMVFHLFQQKFGAIADEQLVTDPDEIQQDDNGVMSRRRAATIAEFRASGDPLPLSPKARDYLNPAVTDEEIAERYGDHAR
jgi:hypothetical protein